MKKIVLLLSCLLFFARLSATVIVFQPPNNYIGPGGGYIFVDINNDGFDDFRLTAYTGWPTDNVSIEGLTNGSMMLTDGAGKTRGLNDNILIGSNFSSNLWELSSDLYIWGQIFPFPLGVITSLPVLIEINGNVHYGYIYLSVNSTSGFTHLNLYRVAYEDVPGLAIKSGALSSITDVAEEVEANFHWSVSSGNLNLDFGQPHRINIGLYGLDGRNLFQSECSERQARIPVDGFASGTYLLRMEIKHPHGKIAMTRKITIVHP
ncbi:MAG: hypothetical protein U0176_22245 [Bacteroidia bacterium]